MDQCHWRKGDAILWSSREIESVFWRIKREECCRQKDWLQENRFKSRMEEGLKIEGIKMREEEWRDEEEDRWEEGYNSKYIKQDSD